jgi:hypothetical protein
MNKKPYEAPTVIKVSLQIKNAILSACLISGSATPFGDCQEEYPVGCLLPV